MFEFVFFDLGVGLFWLLEFKKEVRWLVHLYCEVELTPFSVARCAKINDEMKKRANFFK